MKRCSVPPYEGEEKYIFVSYCHKDRPFVFPIIERMNRDGYRVWYDEGIDPGSEWPEIIARHLNGCSVCVAFISENSLNSHNCRREINFALLKKKNFISVMLEKAQMSLGMEMQLSATQSIFKYTLSDDEFFAKLYQAPFLENCLGTPNPSVSISAPEMYEEEDGLFSENQLNRETFRDEWFIHELPSGGSQPLEEKAPKKQEDISSVSIQIAPEEFRVLEEPAPEEREVPEELPQQEPEKEPIREPLPEAEEGEAPSQTYTAWLIRTKTEEKVALPVGETKLGRSETKVDYIIRNNRVVGRYHALIFNTGTECSVVDQNSLNHTFLNGDVLEPETAYVLHSGDVLRLANENFTFFESTPDAQEPGHEA